MDAIAQAFQEKSLTGSYCTAPLRAYNSWFQHKIQTSQDACERTAWKVCYVVSAIFAYLTLGVLAVVGIAINLCLIPPENGYSIWARLNGIPGATEKFCEKLREELTSASAMSGAEGAEGASGFASFSSDSGYTYHLNQALSFDIQNVFENSPVIQEDDQIDLIQRAVRTLSQKHGWCPEQQWVKIMNDRVTVRIPLPDQISLKFS